MGVLVFPPQCFSAAAAAAAAAVAAADIEHRLDVHTLMYVCIMFFRRTTSGSATWPPGRTSMTPSQRPRGTSAGGRTRPRCSTPRRCRATLRHTVLARPTFCCGGSESCRVLPPFRHEFSFTSRQSATASVVCAVPPLSSCVVNDA